MFCFYFLWVFSLIDKIILKMVLEENTSILLLVFEKKETINKQK